MPNECRVLHIGKFEIGISSDRARLSTGFIQRWHPNDEPKWRKQHELRVFERADAHVNKHTGLHPLRVLDLLGAGLVLAGIPDNNQGVDLQLLHRHLNIAGPAQVLQFRLST